MDKSKANKKNTIDINKKLNIKKKKNISSGIESLKNDLKKAQDENLRYLAEIDNLRKRFDKEKEDTFKYAITEFASEIILVLDNFVRVKDSLSSIEKDGNVKSLIDGIDLIFKDFIKTLEKFEIKEIDSLGKKFDPNFHQAVSEENNDNKEAGQIVKVIQKGYLIKDRLLRPASVVITKKSDIKKN